MRLPPPRVSAEGLRDSKQLNFSDEFPIVNEVIPHTAVEDGVLIPIVEDEETMVPEDQVLQEEKSSGKKPAMYLMDGIKKGFQSHTSVLHEGIKHIHKLHDSLQPKLHDILKAHIKGGAADDVCPIVRVYHKNCGRPCTTHKHCKDPHYACCKVICDDPWDKHSLKKGLFCHRMIEGKLPFQHEPEPWDTHDDHWGGSHGDTSGHHLLEMLFKPKKKPPHHDVLGDKKIYLVGR